MTRVPYILARTLREAHAFAREVLELPRGRYRIVTSPSTLSSVRGVDLHLVPGWEKRHDRFAVKGALRYTRMTVIEHDRAEAPEPESETPFTPVTEEEAEAFFAKLGILEPEGWEPPSELTAEQVLRLAAGETGAQVAPTPTVASEQAEEPAQTVVKTRRRRCKECGVLVEPDEVEEHNRTEHPED